MPLVLTEKQKIGLNILCNPDKRRILFTGGSRSGKTALIVEYMVQRACEFPGSRQLIARKHRNACKTSIWKDTLIKYLRQFIPVEAYNMRESELIVEFWNGSEIYLGGLEDSDAVDKVLGTEYITVFLNEATQLEYGVMNTVSSRLAQLVWKDDHSCTASPKLILDCNPASKYHWLYHVGVKHRDPESKIPLKNADSWASLHWTPYDNAEHLPPDYIESLDALPPLTRSRMLLGEWVSADGLIFPMFNDADHVIEPFELPPTWNRYRAIDFGAVHPTACLMAAMDPSGRLYIYKEYKKCETRICYHAENIEALRGDDFIPVTWSDHDKNARMEYSANGIYCKLANKDFKMSVDEISKRLQIQKDGRPLLYVFKNCEELCGELSGYVWKEAGNNGIPKEEPVKIDDDLVDCLRYICNGVARSGGPRMF